MVAVDYNMVEDILRTRNMIRTEFCESMGHSTSWYTHIRADGVVNYTDYMLIKHLYGVDIKAEEKISKKNNPANNIPVNLAETNQWLCEITAKLDEISEFKSLDDKLSLIIDGLGKMANLQAEILSELKNIPKGVILTKKPEKYTGKCSEAKVMRKSQI